MLNRLLKKRNPIANKLTQEELEAGRKKREQIISDASAMERLLENPDFKRLCEILKEDKEALNANLLNEHSNNMKSAEVKIRLIARINQIDGVLKKPQSLIWRMKNMTEVRDVIKEQKKESNPREASSR
ncbi:MAG: hypothetical protein DRP74_02745 [Candidatus Omnitrophota bacterium]|nr:MAG: hypothetical protein DRP74_02745 [Candidatus Omnitrophota bacterium]